MSRKQILLGQRRLSEQGFQQDGQLRERQEAVVGKDGGDGGSQDNEGDPPAQDQQNQGEDDQQQNYNEEQEGEGTPKENGQEEYDQEEDGDQNYNFPPDEDDDGQNVEDDGQNSQDQSDNQEQEENKDQQQNLDNQDGNGGESNQNSQDIDEGGNSDDDFEDRDSGNNSQNNQNEDDDGQRDGDQNQNSDETLQGDQYELTEAPIFTIKADKGGICIKQYGESCLDEDQSDDDEDDDNASSFDQYGGERQGGGGKQQRRGRVLFSKKSESGISKKRALSENEIEVQNYKDESSYQDDYPRSTNSKKCNELSKEDQELLKSDQNLMRLQSKYCQSWGKKQYCEPLFLKLQTNLQQVDQYNFLVSSSPTKFIEIQGKWSQWDDVELINQALYLPISSYDITFHIFSADGFYILAENNESGVREEVKHYMIASLDAYEEIGNDYLDGPNFFLIDADMMDLDDFKLSYGQTIESKHVAYYFIDYFLYSISWTNDIDFVTFGLDYCYDGYEDYYQCLYFQIDSQLLGWLQHRQVYDMTIHLKDDQGNIFDQTLYFKTYVKYTYAASDLGDKDECFLTMMMQNSTQADGFFFTVYGSDKQYVKNGYEYDIPLTDVDDDGLIVQTVQMQEFAESFKVIETENEYGNSYSLRITLNAKNIDTTQFVDNLKEVPARVILRQSTQPSVFSEYQDCPFNYKMKLCQKTNRQPYFCGEDCGQSSKYVLKILSNRPSQFTLEAKQETRVNGESQGGRRGKRKLQKQIPKKSRTLYEFYYDEEEDEQNLIQMESLQESYDIKILDEEGDAVSATWTGFNDIKYIKDLNLVRNTEAMDSRYGYSLRLNFDLTEIQENQPEQKAEVELSDDFSTGEAVKEELSFEVQFVDHYCENIEYNQRQDCYDCDYWGYIDWIFFCQLDFIEFDTTHRCYGKIDDVSQRCFDCFDDGSRGGIQRQRECQDRVLACNDLEDKSQINSCVKCEDQLRNQRQECYSQFVEGLTFRVPNGKKEEKKQQKTQETKKEQIKEEQVEEKKQEKIELPSGIEAIKVEKSEEDINQMFAQFKNRNDVTKTETESASDKNIKIVPVDFKATISREGGFNMEFNQDMIVPFDLSRRLLSDKIKASYDDFNVSRDLIDINLGEETSNIENLQLTNWDKRNIDIQINFLDPLAVEAGGAVSFELKDPKIFISEASGEPIPASKAKIKKSMPKQLPKGVSESQLEQAASSIKKTMLIVVIVQLAAQKLMGGVIKYIMSMFLILQMVVVINEYGDISLPAQVEIYLQAFQGVVNFDSVSPDFVLEMMYPKILPKVYTVNELITGKEQEFNAYLDKRGKSSVNVLVNMQVYFLVAGVVFVFLLFLAIARYVFVKKRKMIDEYIQSTKKVLVWNGLIESFILQYMVNLVAYKIVIDMKQAQEEISTFDFIMGIVQGFGLLCVPIGMFFFIKKNRKKIEEVEPQFHEKFSVLTKDLHLNRSRNGIYYLPISLLRKFVFINIPILISKQHLQVPFLLIIQTLYIEWYAGIKPHTEKKVQVIELINEVFFMGVIYHMVYLTRIVDTWGLNNMLQYTVGNSLLKVLYIQMGINMVFALYMVLKQTLSERRKKQNQAKYKKLYQELMSHESFYCLKSHEMKYRWMDPEDFHNDSAKCHDCSDEINEGDPYVICESCETYVCLKCSHQYIKKYAKKYRCFQGHRMVIRNDVPLESMKGDVVCDKCQKNISSELFKKHISCRKCQFNICSTCSHIFDTEKLKPCSIKKKQFICIKGHEMKVRESIPEDYPEGVAYCDDCSKTILDGNQFIYCKECERDICRACSFFYVQENQNIQDQTSSSSSESDRTPNHKKNWKGDAVTQDDFDSVTEVKAKNKLQKQQIIAKKLRHLRKNKEQLKTEEIKQDDVIQRQNIQATKSKSRRLTAFKGKVGHRGNDLLDSNQNDLAVINETEGEQNETIQDIEIEQNLVIKAKIK